MKLLVQTFVLPVKGMPELFKQNKCVGIKTRMLSFGNDCVENLIHVSHIEVAAQQHVARTPVVAPHERMDIIYAGFTGRAITQMPHIHFAHKRGIVNIYSFAKLIIDTAMNF